MKKRFFAVALCLCLLVGLIPNMGTTAFAASGHNIGDTVEFAGHEWYIIGTETEGVKAPSGCYTLFAKNSDFGTTAFRAVGGGTEESGANIYIRSDLYYKMDEIAAGFSANDRANIVSRDNLDDISGSSVTNQLVWPIGRNEASAIRSINSTILPFDAIYWGRTGVDTTNAGDFSTMYCYTVVAYNTDGSERWESDLGIAGSWLSTANNVFAVRPALYVKAEAWSDVQFTKQPQIQYAVEGGSVEFSVEATSRSQGTITYNWYAQDKNSGPDGTWYKVYINQGGWSYSYDFPVLTITNVSGGWEEGNTYLFNWPNLQPKDARFRCAATSRTTNETVYSEAVEFVIVASGPGGEDGQEVELRNNGTQIQWKYTDEPDTAWRDLVALDAITGGDGADGADGREVELQVANGYIQWRYTTGGDTDWKNLMSLSDLKGDPGEDGEDGQEVELRNNDTSIQWKYKDEADSAWRDLVALSAITGSDGTDGKQVELRVEGGYIQWKYDADADWQNLIALSALQGIKGEQGDKGDKGDPGEDGKTPYIGDNGNWWIDGVDTGIKATGSSGSDGSDGSNGKDGQDGKDGKDGKDGEDGKDGLTPYIGSNGNWWIGTTDTGVKAAGADGKDGANGKDGKDGVGIADITLNGNGELVVTLTDGTVKNLGKISVTGSGGSDGEDGATGADGSDGKDGVGIADIKLNENGELVVTLTDGTEKNLGKVTGADGVGISGVSINENGELIVTLTDGTELNAGAVPTAAAETSELKTIVYVSMGTAGVSLAGMLGLLAFLLTKRKMLIGK